MDGATSVNLDHVLGFDHLAVSLSNRLFINHAKRLVVRGPSGVGKTTLVTSVVKLVQEAEWEVFWLRGDPGRTDENYAPIRAALNPGRLSRLLGRGVRLVEGLADDFLPKGKTTAKALIALLPRGTTNDDIAALQDSEVPREFFSHVSRSLKSKRVLIVADDIQYFDDRTLKFLNNLVNLQGPDIGAKESVSLLSVLNEEAEVPDKRADAIAALTATLASITIPRCTVEQYPTILKGFGLTVELPADVIELLYDCSRGHLHIARFICEEVGALPGASVDSIPYADLLQYVIRRRLEQVPLEHETLANLLSSAAFIGRSFSYQELACLAGMSEAKARQALRVAERLHFVECEKDEVQFSHEVMRGYFLQYALRQKSTYSAKFSECLRVLRPGDYYVRSIMLLDADEVNNATVAYCQGLIAEWRAGHTDAERLGKWPLADLPMSAEIRTYLNTMRKAHILLAQGNFKETCVLLAALPDIVESPLIAEKDYLYAEALLKDLGASSSQKSVTLLSQWSAIKDEEPELWCRMRLLLLLAHGQLEQYEELKRTEREVVSFLSTRSRFDRNSERQLNRLLAISEMHSSAEIARKRINQACSSYEQKCKDEGIADYYEYFICLTNKAGNAITTCQFIDAVEAGCEALMLCREYPMIRFPAQWAAANNVVIASVLEGRLAAVEGMACLRELLQRFPNMDDDVLVNSNIGGLAILANDPLSALKLFEENSDRLESTPDIDPYYLYLSDSNKAIALQLAGLPGGKAIWEKCAPLTTRLAPAVRHDLLERHEAMISFFDAGCRVRELDIRQPLVSRSRIHSVDRFPSGVFLTDIQIWSSF